MHRVLLVVVLLGSSGCASLFYKAPDLRGSLLQTVEVTSDPPGATVWRDGIHAGVTPAKIKIRRKAPAGALVLEKPGHERLTFPLKRRPSAAVWTNLVWPALALSPHTGSRGLADAPLSRSGQVTLAFVLPAVAVGVDMLSGAAYEFPPRVHVVLKPAAPR